MSPEERIELIRTSLRVFLVGLCSLVPLLGIFPGIYALFSAAFLRAKYRSDWNPAQGYVRWGGWLGAIGLINSGVVLAGAILRAMS